MISALFTDLYQLTMAYGYWKQGMAEREAVFHLNYRKWPFGGTFALAAGLQSAVEFLEQLQFSESDLDYLGELGFEGPFREFLRGFQFACDVDAVPEGRLVFPYEPLVRVKGPLWQAQILESPLLNLINFQTLIATKARRVCQAAGGDPVVEFGMRRAQGPDGALSASRAAYIGGCVATSHVWPGKLWGIPVRGTHAHSWVMAFEEEVEAFEVFSDLMPNRCILLVDTYDSLEGTRRAIQVGLRLRAKGYELAGIRLDSGDLGRLSVACRKLLDEAGFEKAQIMASNELDEGVIRELKARGAPIAIWGVGTHLVTASGQSALDGVYKLSAIRGKTGAWEDRLKLSEQAAKVTHPGILQVRRTEGGDVLYDELVGPPAEKGEDLLVPIMRRGKRVYDFPTLHQVRETALRERIPERQREVRLEPRFAAKKQAMIDRCKR